MNRSILVFLALLVFSAPAFAQSDLDQADNQQSEFLLDDVQVIEQSGTQFVSEDDSEEIEDFATDNISLVEKPMMEIKPFPNPFHDKFTLSTGGGGGKGGKTKSLLGIYDMNGKLVKRRSFTSGDRLQFNTANWGLGVYFVYVFTDAGTVSVKIIKN